MNFKEFVWSDETIEHIARHGVEPHEVEEVCFGKSWVERVKSKGKNPVYYVSGRTANGRFLICVVIRFPTGKACSVTAREREEKEKRRYRKWRNR